MREIENPFEKEVLNVEGTPQNIVVVNKDYKNEVVYKHGIYIVMGTAMVIIIIIVLSGLTYYSSKQQDENMRTRFMEKEITVIQTLKNIEECSMTLSEMADSVDMHIKQGINSLKETDISLKRHKRKGDKNDV